MSDMRIAIPAFFCFPFAWNIFFHPFAFSLYVSLGMKWVFVDNIYMGLVFASIQPVCLLVGAFNPFTFKVIIDIYVPIAIFFGEGNGNPLQVVACRIPWMEEPGGLKSMGSQRVGHD